MPHPRAFLTVTIDTECDKGPRWRVRKPLSFEATWDGIPHRLAPIFRAHGATATYLLSPEVMRDARSVEAIANANHAMELGTHLHCELIHENAPLPDATLIFQRDEPQEAEHLALLTALFTRTFGRAPTSFRAGRFGIGPRSLGALQRLGYAVDSSVTPHVDWSGSGAPGLSFFGAPTQPYRPQLDAPEAPGDGRIIEVPVTIRAHPAARVAAAAAGKFGGALSSRVRSALPARWLRPTRGTSRELVRIIEDEIAAHPGARTTAPCVLTMMFHNVEITPGASPYATDEHAADGILRRLYDVLAYARANDIAVVGLTEAARTWAAAELRAA